MTEKFIGADPGIEVGGTRHRRMTPFENGLLPCPFCGNTDDFEGSPFPNGSHTSWVVRCGVPHCSAELIGETPEDVIDRWNRRIAASKAQTADVEAIREVIKELHNTFSVDPYFVREWSDKLTAALPKE